MNNAKLDIQLHVTNTGTTPFDYCAALHTYVFVDDIHAVRIEGLHGTRFRDRTNGDREDVDQAKELKIVGEIDRNYVDAPSPLVVREPSRSLELEAKGFPDIVVWNPWKAKCEALPDMPNDAYQCMVCIEAVAVAKPLTVDPGATWVGIQSLATHSSMR